jgi:hypothetical protein
VWPLIMRYAPGPLAQTKWECVVLGTIPRCFQEVAGSVSSVATLSFLAYFR